MNIADRKLGGLLSRPPGKREAAKWSSTSCSSGETAEEIPFLTIESLLVPWRPRLGKVNDRGSFYELAIIVDVDLAKGWGPRPKRLDVNARLDKVKPVYLRYVDASNRRWTAAAMFKRNREALEYKKARIRFHQQEFRRTSRH